MKNQSKSCCQKAGDPTIRENEFNRERAFTLKNFYESHERKTGRENSICNPRTPTY